MPVLANNNVDSCKKIVIVGNSGFARECFITLRAVMQQNNNISFKGFLSFEGFKANLKELSTYFLGVDDDYSFAPNEYAIIGIGAPELRQKAYNKLKARGVPFYTLIHPAAYVDVAITMGEANIITSGCYINCNVNIGHANLFNGHIHIGHDCTFGDFNFIGPSCEILGNASLGSGNSLGAISVIMPNATIGNNNIIAPLSAVYKGCRNNLYMAGNPAVKIGGR